MHLTKGSWPQAGFEPYFEYVSSFIHLNINMGSAEACHQYHDEWIGRYRKRMSSWSEYDVAAWSIRMRQSLKFAFSATYFALSSEQSRKEGLLAAAYYLAYYAAFHAMWSVLLLHPDESHEAVADVTHSKVTNVFHSVFASGNRPILKIDARAFVENLRFLREYYSYRMPLNFPFNGVPDLKDAHISLGGFVKQSIQLANLHSHFICKAAEREEMSLASVPRECHPQIRELFHKMCGKSHPSEKIPILDPADEAALDRLLCDGCHLFPHAAMYDFMFDEYMTYSEEPSSKDLVQRVRTLVFNAFI
jgi:hypothetical protein